MKYRDPGRGSGRGLDGESFIPWFPTPTSGDGLMRPNNARPGKDQPNGRPSNKRKVYCQNCGYPADLHQAVSDGGDLSGNGGGGAIDTSNDGAGDQAYTRGSGCYFCFSRAFSKAQPTRTGA